MEVLAMHYGFWSLNATRIVYVVDKEEPVRRYGFAFGALGSLRWAARRVPGGVAGGRYGLV